MAYTLEQAKTRIKKLKTLIEKYRYAYHVLDKSLVSEAVNDSLKYELQDLENQFPQLVTPDSPTQRVGGKPLEKFIKVEHIERMLSLVDAFNIKEIIEWQKRIAKLSKIENGFFCEIKVDGLAVELEYTNGKFTHGSTRGDGKIGEDITQNLKTVEAIPLSLPCHSERGRHGDRAEESLSKVKGSLHGACPERKRGGRDDMIQNITIRGEAYMKKKTLEELNKKYKKENKPILANTRNAAAGSLRQLDSKLTAERKLSFMAWDLLDNEVKTHEEKHKKLEELGFATVPGKYCVNIDAIEKYIEEIEKKRGVLPYNIDGIWVGVNNVKTFNKLGIVGKTPRGAIAYKFPAEQTTTKIKDIIVQVGRQGTLTPVAVLEPVLVAGSTISRATLHNENEINKKDIRIGDTVIIQKAGDVIPEVVKSLKELRTSDEKKFTMVKICPVCKSPVAKKMIQSGKEKSAASFCTNKKCFAQQQQKIHHFVSRNAFDLRGVGPKIIDKLLEVGLIKEPVDLFELTIGDLEPLERFAEKSAKNIVDEIQNKKEITLNRFLYGLGIVHVGEVLANDIANHFGSLQKIEKATGMELNNVYGIGSETVKEVIEFFKDESNLQKIRKLENFVKIIPPKKVTQTLADKNFVITGSLESMTREEAEEKIRAKGGRASSSVSKETSFVVAGVNPGSKFDRAKKLNVPIINEKKLISMLA